MLDSGTTLVGLSLGRSEVNPIADVAAHDHVLSAFIALKMVVSLMIVGIAYRLPERSGFLLLCVVNMIVGLVLINNLWRIV